jgi:N-ethylmaleimide reductase
MTSYPELEESYQQLLPALAQAGLVYLHLVDHAAMGNPPIPEDFRRALKQAWPRSFILGGSLDAEKAEAALQAGECDLAGIGRSFISNPDLVRRMREGIALTPPETATFYTPGAKGYSDYAFAA